MLFGFYGKMVILIRAVNIHGINIEAIVLFLF